MTKPKPGPDKITYRQLQHLLEIQATILRRALITGDLLRWKLLDAGLTIDRPPDMRHPVTGREPPGAELVWKEREEMEIIAVPAVNEMAKGDFSRHLDLRHAETVTDEATHSAEHYRSQLDHYHMADAWARKQAAMADVRFNHPSIDPLNSETIGDGEYNG